MDGVAQQNLTLQKCDSCTAQDRIKEWGKRYLAPMLEWFGIEFPDRVVKVRPVLLTCKVLPARQAAATMTGPGHWDSSTPCCFHAVSGLLRNGSGALQRKGQNERRA